MDFKSCVKILSSQKFRPSSCAMPKMAIIRIGVGKKHCSAFALFSKGLYPQTGKVYINERLNEGRIKGCPWGDL